MQRGALAHLLSRAAHKHEIAKVRRGLPMLAPEEPKLITPKLLWKGRSLIYGVQDLIALERCESRDAEVGCGRLPSLISPFSRAPTPAGCATSATARGR